MKNNKQQVDDDMQKLKDATENLLIAACFYTHDNKVKLLNILDKLKNCPKHLKHHIKALWCNKTVKNKKHKFVVKYKQWRETWSGHDQCDGWCSDVVEARYPCEAKRKVIRKWSSGLSHCCWTTDMTVDRM